MTPIDPRILTAGMTISLDTLVTVYKDHWRGIPASMVCPSCGHRFPPDNSRAECPTSAVVGPLILRRRRENPDAVDRLTRDQWFGLVARRTSPLEHRQTYQPATDAALFDLNPTRRNGGMR